MLQRVANRQTSGLFISVWLYVILVVSLPFLCNLDGVNLTVTARPCHGSKRWRHNINLINPRLICLLKRFGKMKVTAHVHK